MFIAASARYSGRIEFPVTEFLPAARLHTGGRFTRAVLGQESVAFGLQRRFSFDRLISLLIICTISRTSAIESDDPSAARLPLLPNETTEGRPHSGDKLAACGGWRRIRYPWSRATGVSGSRAFESGQSQVHRSDLAAQVTTECFG